MVYIEQVIFYNFLINAALIKLAAAVLSQKVRLLRVVAASLVGTVFAVFLPFVERFVFVYKICALAFTTAFAFKRSRIKIYLLRTLVFAAVSFGVGGAVFATSFLLSDGKSFVELSALRLILLIGAVLAGTLYLFGQLDLFRRRRQISGLKGYAADITLGDDTFSVKYLDDSGNTLCDDVTAKPVFVLSHDLGAKYIDRNPRLLRVDTVNASAMLPLINVRKLVIHTDKGVFDLGGQLAVVSDKTLDGYKAIINGALYNVCA